MKVPFMLPRGWTLSILLNVDFHVRIIYPASFKFLQGDFCRNELSQQLPRGKEINLKLLRSNTIYSSDKNLRYGPLTDDFTYMYKICHGSLRTCLISAFIPATLAIIRRRFVLLVIKLD